MQFPLLLSQNVAEYFKVVGSLQPSWQIPVLDVVQLNISSPLLILAFYFVNVFVFNIIIYKYKSYAFYYETHQE